MNKEMYDKLNETESYHWWFKAKRKIVMDLSRRYLKYGSKRKLSIADIGCGTGTFLHELESKGEVTGYDFSETALAYCRKKTHAKLKQLDLDIELTGTYEAYDMVFALDIIEHIKHDNIAMENLYKMTKEGGHTVVTTPAFQWLWSQNDKNNMHFRRYSLSRLKNLAETAGFSVEYISYYNFWLFLPTAIVRLVCKVFSIDKHSFIEYNSGNGIFNCLLYKIFSSESRRLSKYRHFPFGVSLIMLLAKPTSKNVAKSQDDENSYWDRITEEYADEIMAIQPTFFKNGGKLINGELQRGLTVADIGNGGVINYQYERLKKLDCIDLTTSKSAIEKYKNVSNVEFKSGNIFHLSEVKDGTYDRVIVQCVIHHLAGDNFQITKENTLTAISECMRILKIGGKLLIVESTVVPWFEKIERLFYAPMQWFFRVIKFDVTYQYSAPSLIALIRSQKLNISSSQMIEIGRYMWLLKHKVPNKLTPCRAVWICIEKDC